ncbi:MAG: damage-inducible protein D [Alphaproteobacteria bacterium]|nr:damage-inducible protein D [Alphaproteobacteria bacterium]
MSNENVLVSLEDLSKQNGITYWTLEDIALFFDYKDISNFKNVVNKAIAFSTELLGDGVHEEFKPIFENDRLKTYKLSRFGVLLCAMFASESKPNVKEIRISLANLANFMFQDIERLRERKELTHGEKYMVNVAYNQGLDNNDIGMFKDAGYRGMYNMGLKDLKNYKGVSQNATLYDFMGITELAANTFRVTQTAENIKRNNINTRAGMIGVAKDIGKQVRGIVMENTGNTPENLPTEPKINVINQKVKKGRTQINKDK